jgi:hypothetical protein
MQDNQVDLNYQFYLQKFKLYVDLPKIVFYISLGFAGLLFIIAIGTLGPILEYYPEYFLYLLLGTGFLVGLAFLVRFLTEIVISPTVIITLTQIRAFSNQTDASSTKDKSITKKDLRDIL